MGEMLMNTNAFIFANTSEIHAEGNPNKVTKIFSEIKIAPVITLSRKTKQNPEPATIDLIEIEIDARLDHGDFLYLRFYINLEDMKRVLDTFDIAANYREFDPRDP